MNNKTYGVITGASSGIGIEFAKRLKYEGFNLVLIARRGDRLKTIADTLSSEDTIVRTIVADLSSTSECRRVVNELSSLPVEVFINNAGFGDCGFFPETDLSKDLNMIDVNIKAMHYFTKEMVKKMAAQPSGYILNVASSAGLIPGGPYMATYYASKAYVTSLTRAVSRELKEQHSNLYLGCLCPGPVDTEFNSVANVKFSLKGITPGFCANYAIDCMKKKKTVIIPGFKMKLAMNFGRLLPQALYIKLAGHQQKKKIYG